jgi:hypothetical protein
MLIDCNEALIVRCVAHIVTESILFRGVVDTAHHWSAADHRIQIHSRLCLKFAKLNLRCH